MKDNVLEQLWETLEKSLAMLESGEGDQRQLTQAVRSALPLLLAHDPSQVVEMAGRSAMPTRSLLSWLVFEAARLDQESESRARALQGYWEGQAGLQPGLMAPTLVQAVE